MTEQDNHNCEVYHFDLYGTREEKCNYLQTHNLSDVQWQQLNPQAPSFFFVPKDDALKEEYEKGFSISNLMKVNANGIVSSRDSLLIKEKVLELERIKLEFNSLSEEEFRRKYKITDSRDWTYSSAKGDVKLAEIVPISYRPFDNQFVLYTAKSKGILSYPRYEIMRHLLYGYLRDAEGIDNNIALVLPRQCIDEWRFVFCTKYIADKNLLASAQKLGAGNVFPLFLYPEEGSIETDRRVNMDEAIMAKILLGAAVVKRSSPAESEKVNANETSALQVFDYIYGILHSPAYRTKYKEFLKVDFPRIPYPKDQAVFDHFRSYGQQLRLLHLMDSATMHRLSEKYRDIATFPESGNMMVEQVAFDAGEDDRVPRVRINATQYFSGVPKAAWDFYIGGYQPAQKWLKDRKGRTLSFDDIQHYRRIIAVLLETQRLIDEIDLIHP